MYFLFCFISSNLDQLFTIPESNVRLSDVPDIYSKTDNQKIEKLLFFFIPPYGNLRLSKFKLFPSSFFYISYVYLFFQKLLLKNNILTIKCRFVTEKHPNTKKSDGVHFSTADRYYFVINRFFTIKSYLVQSRKNYIAYIPYDLCNLIIISVCSFFDV